MALLVGYCGDKYYGSQYNEHHEIDGPCIMRPTIEGELFRALVKSRLISDLNSKDFKKNRFQRTTRTDKGVHALANVISMKLMIPKDIGKTKTQIIDKINDNLPTDIRVWNIQRVNKNFNARKACGWRKYEYMMPTYMLMFSKKNLKDILERNMNRTFPSEGELDLIRRYPTLDMRTDKLDSNETRDINLSKLNDLIERYLTTVQNELIEYRLSEDRFNQFKELLQKFQGTHDFHNYTSIKKRDSKPNSTRRQIIAIDVSKPYNVSFDGYRGEWISIILKGQSFLLHQIRKMISMSVMTLINGFTSNHIYSTFDSKQINIPKAPSLGLILRETNFHSYNRKLQGIGYEPIITDTNEDAICDDANNILKFKEEQITSTIIENEFNRKEFIKYLHYITYSPYTLMT